MALILSTKSRCRAGYKTHKKVGNIRHCYPKATPAKRTANRGMVGADAALKAKLAKARADFIKKDASPKITPLPKKPIRPVGIQIDEI